MDRPYETPAELRNQLRIIFREEAIGIGRAVKLVELQSRLPGFGKRSIRKAISELVRVQGVPIVSDSHAGYYRAETAEQLRQGATELRRRAMALLVRRKQLLDQGQHELGGQMDLMRDVARTEAAMAMLGEEPFDGAQDRES